MSAYLMIDVLIAGVLSFFALKGLKKGLVLSVMSALTLIIALVGARFASAAFSPRMEGVVKPIVGDWVGAKAGDISSDVLDGIGTVTDPMIYETVKMFGFGENHAQSISESVSSRLSQTGDSLQAALTASLAAMIARIFTFILAFLMITLALFFASRLLDTAAKLPVLNLANKLGGLAGGLLQGGVIVWLAVYILRFAGVIDPEAFEHTVLLRLLAAVTKI